MKRAKRRLALLAAAAFLLACRPAAETPTQTVQLYFRWMGRDPGRTLLILSPDFHLRHELPGFWLGDSMARVTGQRTPVRPDLQDLESKQPARSEVETLDARRIGWLTVQQSPTLQRLAPLLAITILDESQTGDRAQVLVRVDPPRGVSFRQRFLLLRDRPQSPWQIDAIEQLGVGEPWNRLAAFAAYPHNPAARRQTPLEVPPR